MALAAAAAGLAGTRVLAAEAALVLHEDRITPSARAMNGYFGHWLNGAGDTNGDGYGDVVIGAMGASRAYAYLGTPDGIDTATEVVLVPELTGGLGNDFGWSVVSGDFDQDGYSDVAVGERISSATEGGAVNLYYGKPTGISAERDDKLLPLAASYTRSDSFSSGLDAADLDDDGFVDLVVGAWTYVDSDDRTVGAVYLYFGSATGIVKSSEVRLLNAESMDWATIGWRVTAAGDLDGDGFKDTAVTFSEDELSQFQGRSVFVYRGDGRDTADSEPTVLQGIDPETDWWEVFGLDLTAADLDDDGYDDLVVGSYGAAYLFYGSASGARPGTQQTLIPRAGTDVNHFGESVSAHGDVDGDGVDDLLVGAAYEVFDEQPNTAYLYFGGPGGISTDTELEIRSDESTPGDYFGFGARIVGDVNADGLDDLVIPAALDGRYEGAAYFYRPVCDWYRDGDGDGAGDPAEHLESCAEPDGYADNDDDCDDTDASTQGRTWYVDADGDGYGTLAGAVLACTQPEGTAENWWDCDDGDATVYPGAPETGGDGVDQDCDGDDASGGALVDGGDDDTGQVDGGAQADGGSSTPAERREPPDDGCGCAATTSTSVAWLLSVLGLAVRRRGVDVDQSE